MNNLEKISLELQSLVIFRNLLQDRALSGLMALLLNMDKPVREWVNNYSSFVSELFRESVNLSDYVLERVLTDDNIYVRTLAREKTAAPALDQCLGHELRMLEGLSRMTSGEIRAYFDYDGYLPEWGNREIDFTAAYMERIADITRTGFGMYSRYHMFTVREETIVPVKSSDQITLSDLRGYEAERGVVIENTLALLEGKKAANVLLYGDAGTGKSSTVKALANSFAERGLRLVEIPKKRLFMIRDAMEELSGNPLKFILFVDDLSFAEENEDFGAIKAVLEGSVIARAQNVVIYATGNRRHLVKESFSNRESDIHHGETVQELISLSERFGLSVNFSKPDKARYMEIVDALSERYKIKMPPEELAEEAERYALLRGGRSPRAARQFMEYLAIKN